MNKKTDQFKIKRKEMKNLKIIVWFIFVINTFFTLGAKEIGLGINANFETLVLKKTLACDVPTNLVHSNITSTTATVGCDPVNGATGYEFAHKINGGSCRIWTGDHRVAVYCLTTWLRNHIYTINE